MSRTKIMSNFRIVNEEFNQHAYLFQLFIDTYQKYHSKQTLSIQRRAANLTRLIRISLHSSTLSIITFKAATKIVQDILQITQKVKFIRIIQVPVLQRKSYTVKQNIILSGLMLESSDMTQNKLQQLAPEVSNINIKIETANTRVNFIKASEQKFKVIKKKHLSNNLLEKMQLP